MFEHGDSYFAPPLVHAAPLTNWTHVAVVYRDGQPRLYLNGVLAHTGLRSAHVVHSGVGQGGRPKFAGKLGTFEKSGRALADAEVAELAKSMPCPKPGAALPPLQLTRNAAGSLLARAAEPGEYAWRFADGHTQKLTVPSVPAPIELTGAWEVGFAPGWGAPERVTFDELTDWTKRTEDGIRHFSGHATYRKTFALPAAALAPGASLILDLGEVCDLAVVRVNGREVATLWLAPWQVDITSAAKPGANTLEIVVVNPWHNRLVGDAALPAAERRTYLSDQTVRRNEALLPAGLLGPVVLRAVQTVATADAGH